MKTDMLGYVTEEGVTPPPARDWSMYGECGKCGAHVGEECISVTGRGKALKGAHPGRTKLSAPEPSAKAQESAPVISHKVDVQRTNLAGYGLVWNASCSCEAWKSDWYNSPDAAETQGRKHVAQAGVSS